MYSLRGGKNATLRDTGLEISNRKETITASKAYLSSGLKGSQIF